MSKARPSTNNCQLCDGGLRRYDTYYDANTITGHWAWICRECWQFYGVGLGTGLGQEYDSATNMKLRG